MPIKWQPFKNFGGPGGPVGQGGPIGPVGPEEFPDLFGENGGGMPFLPMNQIEEPALDIYQDKNNLYLEISLGGMKPENIEISIKNNILTIQGKSEVKEEIKEKNYLRKEINRGAFRRVIKLPIDVQEKKASAEASSGLLKITMPKKSKTDLKASKVPIKIK